MGKFEIIKHKRFVYSWRLVDKDGVRMTSGRTYMSHWSTKRGIRRVVKLAAEAPIVLAA